MPCRRRCCSDRRGRPHRFRASRAPAPRVLRMPPTHVCEPRAKKLPSIKMSPASAYGSTGIVLVHDARHRAPTASEASPPGNAKILRVALAEMKARSEVAVSWVSGTSDSLSARRIEIRVLAHAVTVRERSVERRHVHETLIGDARDVAHVPNACVHIPRADGIGQIIDHAVDVGAVHRVLFGKVGERPEEQRGITDIAVEIAAHANCSRCARRQNRD